MKSIQQINSLAETRNEALIDLAATLVQQNDYEQILKIVSHYTANMLRADTTLVLLINPQTRQTVKTVIREGYIEQNREYRNLQNQLSGWILENKQPIIIENLRSDQRFKNLLLRNIKVSSIIGVPIWIERILFGVLLALNEHDKNFFSSEDLKHLEKVAVIAAPYLRNAQKISSYFESPLPEAALLSKYADLGLLGKSKPFVDILKAVESAARCDASVVLEGRSGTGKELIARAIHKLSERREKPFVAIDCSAMNEETIVSELFGHVRGAFTGATQDRKGLFVEANGGTLFIDEISNISLNIQVMLLRALQQREVRPVGSDKVHTIDVRLIAASNRSLTQIVEKREFREDLYYRLYVFPLKLPSLNERKEDIPILANEFLKRFAAKQKKKVKSFHEEIVDFMKLRPWSGNIRELENFVERLVAIAPDTIELIAPTHLPEELKEEFKKFSFDEAYVTASLSERVEAFEKDIILKALIRHNWKQAKAARELKISHQALRYKMDRFNIQPSK